MWRKCSSNPKAEKAISIRYLHSHLLDSIVRQSSEHERLPLHAIEMRMGREEFTLETIYRDALEEIRLRRDSDLLSSRDYNVITSTHDVLELYTLLMTAESSKNVTCFPAAKTKTRNVVEPILLRFERFGTAIDMLAQSSPQVMGISAVGLLWGSLKLVFTVSG